MEPVECAARSAEGIGSVPSYFMLDGATYERGGELGFEGFDFYTAGRGGPLGDVDGAVIAAAFVFFDHAQIAQSWDRGRKVSAPGESAAEFAGCLRKWARAHLADGPDYGRLAELAGRVTAGADLAAVPLFGAWRGMPEPDAPAELALHRLNLLRELRGGFHGAAVVTSGLSPMEALTVKTPFMAAVMGWTDPLPDAEPLRPAWEQAEQATNVAMGRALAGLDAAERAELVELVTEVQGAVV